MTNTNYTTLPLSKLIAERLPDLETEMWHTYRDENTKYNPGMYAGLTATKDKAEFHPEVMVYRYTPACSFTDCLRAIEMLGEIVGEVGWSRTKRNKIKHRLFDAFIADQLTIGKHTVEYLTELFSKEK